MKNQNPNPLDAALARIESILGQASTWAKSVHSMMERKTNPEVFAAMIARELVIRDAISESCRVWIETGNRKPMLDDDAILFYFRLFYGSKLCRWIQSGGFVAPTRSVNEVLIWLLIDSWPEVAEAMWKLDLSPEF